MRWARGIVKREVQVSEERHAVCWFRAIKQEAAGFAQPRHLLLPVRVLLARGRAPAETLERGLQHLPHTRALAAGGTSLCWASPAQQSTTYECHRCPTGSAKISSWCTYKHEAYQ